MIACIFRSDATISKTNPKRYSWDFEFCSGESNLSYWFTFWYLRNPAVKFDFVIVTTFVTLNYEITCLSPCYDYDLFSVSLSNFTQPVLREHCIRDGLVFGKFNWWRKNQKIEMRIPHNFTRSHLKNTIINSSAPEAHAPPRSFGPARCVLRLWRLTYSGLAILYESRSVEGRTAGHFWDGF